MLLRGTLVTASTTMVGTAAAATTGFGVFASLLAACVAATVSKGEGEWERVRVKTNAKFSVAPLLYDKARSALFAVVGSGSDSSLQLQSVAIGAKSGLVPHALQSSLPAAVSLAAPALFELAGLSGLCAIDAIARSTVTSCPVARAIATVMSTILQRKKTQERLQTIKTVDICAVCGTNNANVTNANTSKSSNQIEMYSCKCSHCDSHPTVVCEPCVFVLGLAKPKRSCFNNVDNEDILALIDTNVGTSLVDSAQTAVVLHNALSQSLSMWAFDAATATVSATLCTTAAHNVVTPFPNQMCTSGNLNGCETNGAKTALVVDPLSHTPLPLMDVVVDTAVATVQNAYSRPASVRVYWDAATGVLRGVVPTALCSASTAAIVLTCSGNSGLWSDRELWQVSSRAALTLTCTQLAPAIRPFVGAKNAGVFSAFNASRKDDSACMSALCCLSSHNTTTNLGLAHALTRVTAALAHDCAVATVSERVIAAAVEISARLLIALAAAPNALAAEVTAFAAACSRARVQSVSETTAAKSATLQTKAHNISKGRASIAEPARCVALSPAQRAVLEWRFACETALFSQAAQQNDTAAATTTSDNPALPWFMSLPAASAIKFALRSAFIAAFPLLYPSQSQRALATTSLARIAAASVNNGNSTTLSNAKEQAELVLLGLGAAAWGTGLAPTAADPTATHRLPGVSVAPRLAYQPGVLDSNSDHTVGATWWPWGASSARLAVSPAELLLPRAAAGWPQPPVAGATGTVSTLPLPLPLLLLGCGSRAGLAATVPLLAAPSVLAKVSATHPHGSAAAASALALVTLAARPGPAAVAAAALCNHTMLTLARLVLPTDTAIFAVATQPSLAPLPFAAAATAVPVRTAAAAAGPGDPQTALALPHSLHPPLSAVAGSSAGACTGSSASAPPNRAGTEVRARWNSGSFYPAIVRAVNADGSYQVTFQDGDLGVSVPADCVVPLLSAHSTLARARFARVLPPVATAVARACGALRPPSPETVDEQGEVTVSRNRAWPERVCGPAAGARGGVMFGATPCADQDPAAYALAPLMIYPANLTTSFQTAWTMIRKPLTCSNTPHNAATTRHGGASASALVVAAAPLGGSSGLTGSGVSGFLSFDPDARALALPLVDAERGAGLLWAPLTDAARATARGLDRVPLLAEARIQRAATLSGGVATVASVLLTSAGNSVDAAPPYAHASGIPRAQITAPTANALLALSSVLPSIECALVETLSGHGAARAARELALLTVAAQQATARAFSAGQAAALRLLLSPSDGATGAVISSACETLAVATARARAAVALAGVGTAAVGSTRASLRALGGGLLGDIIVSAAELATAAAGVEAMSTTLAMSDNGGDSVNAAPGETAAQAVLRSSCGVIQQSPSTAAALLPWLAGLPLVTLTALRQNSMAALVAAAPLALFEAGCNPAAVVSAPSKSHDRAIDSGNTTAVAALLNAYAARGAANAAAGAASTAALSQLPLFAEGVGYALSDGEGGLGRDETDTDNGMGTNGSAGDNSVGALYERAYAAPVAPSPAALVSSLTLAVPRTPSLREIPLLPPPQTLMPPNSTPPALHRAYKAIVLLLYRKRAAFPAQRLSACLARTPIRSKSSLSGSTVTEAVATALLPALALPPPPAPLLPPARPEVGAALLRRMLATAARTLALDARRRRYMDAAASAAAKTGSLNKNNSSCCLQWEREAAQLAFVRDFVAVPYRPGILDTLRNALVLPSNLPATSAAAAEMRTRIASITELARTQWIEALSAHSQSPAFLASASASSSSATASALTLCGALGVLPPLHPQSRSTSTTAPPALAALPQLPMVLSPAETVATIIAQCLREFGGGAGAFDMSSVFEVEKRFVAALLANEMSLSNARSASAQAKAAVTRVALESAHWCCCANADADGAIDAAAETAAATASGAESLLELFAAFAHSGDAHALLAQHLRTRARLTAAPLLPSWLLRLARAAFDGVRQPALALLRLDFARYASLVQWVAAETKPVNARSSSSSISNSMPASEVKAVLPLLPVDAGYVQPAPNTDAAGALAVALKLRPQSAPNSNHNESESETPDEGLFVPSLALQATLRRWARRCDFVRAGFAPQQRTTIHGHRAAAATADLGDKLGVTADTSRSRSRSRSLSLAPLLQKQRSLLAAPVIVVEDLVVPALGLRGTAHTPEPSKSSSPANKTADSDPCAAPVLGDVSSHEAAQKHCPRCCYLCLNANRRRRNSGVLATLNANNADHHHQPESSLPTFAFAPVFVVPPRGIPFFGPTLTATVFLRGPTSGAGVMSLSWRWLSDFACADVSLGRRALLRALRHLTVTARVRSRVLGSLAGALAAPPLLLRPNTTAPSVAAAAAVFTAHAAAQLLSPLATAALAAAPTGDWVRPRATSLAAPDAAPPSASSSGTGETLRGLWLRRTLRYGASCLSAQTVLTRAATAGAAEAIAHARAGVVSIRQQARTVARTAPACADSFVTAHWAARVFPVALSNDASVHALGAAVCGLWGGGLRRTAVESGVRHALRVWLAQLPVMPRSALDRCALELAAMDRAAAALTDAAAATGQCRGLGAVAAALIASAGADALVPARALALWAAEMQQTYTALTDTAAAIASQRAANTSLGASSSSGISGVGTWRGSVMPFTARKELMRPLALTLTMNASQPMLDGPQSQAADNLSVADFERESQGASPIDEVGASEPSPGQSAIIAAFASPIVSPNAGAIVVASRQPPITALIAALASVFGPLAPMPRPRATPPRAPALSMLVTQVGLYSHIFALMHGGEPDTATTAPTPATATAPGAALLSARARLVMAPPLSVGADAAARARIRAQVQAQTHMHPTPRTAATSATAGVFGSDESSGELAAAQAAANALAFTSEDDTHGFLSDSLSAVSYGANGSNEGFALWTPRPLTAATLAGAVSPTVTTTGGVDAVRARPRVRAREATVSAGFFAFGGHSSSATRLQPLMTDSASTNANGEDSDGSISMASPLADSTHAPAAPLALLTGSIATGPRVTFAPGVGTGLGADHPAALASPLASPVFGVVPLATPSAPSSASLLQASPANSAFGGHAHRNGTGLTAGVFGRRPSALGTGAGTGTGSGAAHRGGAFQWPPRTPAGPGTPSAWAVARGLGLLSPSTSAGAGQAASTGSAGSAAKTPLVPSHVWDREASVLTLPGPAAAAHAAVPTTTTVAGLDDADGIENVTVVGKGMSYAVAVPLLPTHAVVIPGSGRQDSSTAGGALAVAATAMTQQQPHPHPHSAGMPPVSKRGANGSAFALWPTVSQTPQGGTAVTPTVLATKSSIFDASVLSAAAPPHPNALPPLPPTAAARWSALVSAIYNTADIARVCASQDALARGQVQGESTAALAPLFPRCVQAGPAYAKHVSGDVEASVNIEQVDALTALSRMYSVGSFSSFGSSDDETPLDDRVGIESDGDGDNDSERSWRRPRSPYARLRSRQRPRQHSEATRQQTQQQQPLNSNLQQSHPFPTPLSPRSVASARALMSPTAQRRFLRSLRPGHLVDARDLHGKWFFARVVSVHAAAVRVTFDGWRNNFDETIPFALADRIAPFGTVAQLADRRKVEAELLFDLSRWWEQVPAAHTSVGTGAGPMSPAMSLSLSPTQSHRSHRSSPPLSPPSFSPRPSSVQQQQQLQHKAGAAAEVRAVLRRQWRLRVAAGERVRSELTVAAVAAARALACVRCELGRSRHHVLWLLQLLRHAVSPAHARDIGSECDNSSATEQMWVPAAVAVAIAELVAAALLISAPRAAIASIVNSSCDGVANENMCVARALLCTIAAAGDEHLWLRGAASVSSADLQHKDNAVIGFSVTKHNVGHGKSARAWVWDSEGSAAALLALRARVRETLVLAMRALVTVQRGDPALTLLACAAVSPGNRKQEAATGFAHVLSQPTPLAWHAAAVESILSALSLDPNDNGSTSTDCALKNVALAAAALDVIGAFTPPLRAGSLVSVTVPPAAGAVPGVVQFIDWRESVAHVRVAPIASDEPAVAAQSRMYTGVAEEHQERDGGSTNAEPCSSSSAPWVGTPAAAPALLYRVVPLAFVAPAPRHGPLSVTALDSAPVLLTNSKGKSTSASSQSSAWVQKPGSVLALAVTALAVSTANKCGPDDCVDNQEEIASSVETKAWKAVRAALSARATAVLQRWIEAGDCDMLSLLDANSQSSVRTSPLPLCHSAPSAAKFVDALLEDHVSSNASQDAPRAGLVFPGTAAAVTIAMPLPTAAAGLAAAGLASRAHDWRWGLDCSGIDTDTSSNAKRALPRPPRTLIDVVASEISTNAGLTVNTHILITDPTNDGTANTNDNSNAPKLSTAALSAYNTMPVASTNRAMPVGASPTVTVTERIAPALGPCLPRSLPQCLAYYVSCFPTDVSIEAGLTQGPSEAGPFPQPPDPGAAARAARRADLWGLAAASLSISVRVPSSSPAVDAAAAAAAAVGESAMPRALVRAVGAAARAAAGAAAALLVGRTVALTPAAAAAMRETLPTLAARQRCGTIVACAPCGAGAVAAAEAAAAAAAMRAANGDNNADGDEDNNAGNTAFVAVTVRSSAQRSTSPSRENNNISAAATMQRSRSQSGSGSGARSVSCGSVRSATSMVDSDTGAGMLSRLNAVESSQGDVSQADSYAYQGNGTESHGDTLSATQSGMFVPAPLPGLLRHGSERASAMTSANITPTAGTLGLHLRLPPLPAATSRGSASFPARSDGIELEQNRNNAAAAAMEAASGNATETFMRVPLPPLVGAVLVHFPPLGDASEGLLGSNPHTLSFRGLAPAAAAGADADAAEAAAAGAGADAWASSYVWLRLEDLAPLALPLIPATAPLRAPVTETVTLAITLRNDNGDDSIDYDIDDSNSREIALLSAARALASGLHAGAAAARRALLRTLLSCGGRNEHACGLDVTRAQRSMFRRLTLGTIRTATAATSNGSQFVAPLLPPLRLALALATRVPIARLVDSSLAPTAGTDAAVTATALRSVSDSTDAGRARVVVALPRLPVSTPSGLAMLNKSLSTALIAPASIGAVAAALTPAADDDEPVGGRTAAFGCPGGDAATSTAAAVKTVVGCLLLQSSARTVRSAGTHNKSASVPVNVNIAECSAGMAALAVEAERLATAVMTAATRPEVTISTLLHSERSCLVRLYKPPYTVNRSESDSADTLLVSTDALVLGFRPSGLTVPAVVTVSADRAGRVPLHSLVLAPSDAAEDLCGMPADAAAAAAAAAVIVTDSRTDGGVDSNAAGAEAAQGLWDGGHYAGGRHAPCSLATLAPTHAWRVCAYNTSYRSIQGVERAQERPGRWAHVGKRLGGTRVVAADGTPEPGCLLVPNPCYVRITATDVNEAPLIVPPPLSATAVRAATAHLDSGATQELESGVASAVRNALTRGNSELVNAQDGLTTVSGCVVPGATAAREGTHTEVSLSLHAVAAPPTVARSAQPTTSATDSTAVGLALGLPTLLSSPHAQTHAHRQQQLQQVRTESVAVVRSGAATAGQGVSLVPAWVRALVTVTAAPPSSAHALLFLVRVLARAMTRHSLAAADCERAQSALTTIAQAAAAAAAATYAVGSEGFGVDRTLMVTKATAASKTAEEEPRERTSDLFSTTNERSQLACLPGLATIAARATHALRAGAEAISAAQSATAASAAHNTALPPLGAAVAKAAGLTAAVMETSSAEQQNATQCFARETGAEGRAPLALGESAAPLRTLLLSVVTEAALALTALPARLVAAPTIAWLGAELAAAGEYYGPCCVLPGPSKAQPGGSVRRNSHDGNDIEEQDWITASRLAVGGIVGATVPVSTALLPLRDLAYAESAALLQAETARSAAKAVSTATSAPHRGSGGSGHEGPAGTAAGTGPLGPPLVESGGVLFPYVAARSDASARRFEAVVAIERVLRIAIRVGA